MTGSETEQAPRLLPSLTAFRWYAAVVVFLYHLNLRIAWRPLHPFNIGPSGVTFFFVLSGFVLTWSIVGDPSPSRFYRRRIARIYPATLASQLAAGALLLIGVPGIRGGVLGAITGVLLIQAWFPGASYPVFAFNGVVWTLSCEAFFYALLPVLVLVRWANRAVVAVTAGCVLAAVVATWLLTHSGHGEIGGNNPIVRLPEFLVGVALGLLVRRGWRPSLPLWQAVALTVVCAAVAHHWFSWSLLDYIMLPGFLAILIAGIGSDLDGHRGFFTSRLSVYLGELSFCFYLVHVLVIDAVVDATGWSHRRFTVVSGVPALAFCLGCSIIAAMVLRRFVELPMQQRLRPRRG